MLSNLNDRLNQYSEYAPLILRLALGIVFLVHGWSKLGNLDGMAQMFGGMGVPAPGLMATLVAIVETLGGLALILGIGTRVAAVFLSIVMLVAIVMVKIDLGLIAPTGASMPGAELDLALLAGLVALILQGAGRLSLDQAVLQRA
ncbi:MAG: putative oxidoreductase CatD [Anaerolineales bacterium]|nr:putative oxidoreductase CatD [Anaerolineales bacterium]